MFFSFSKYEGTGNDFILIDDREKVFPFQSVDIPKLCHRQYGIGADGLILVQPSKKGDFFMRIFNSNGKEAEMCGNGLRCLVDFLYALKAIKNTVSIETLSGIYPGEWSAQEIRIGMGLPKVMRVEKDALFVNVGVPHLVVFVDDLQRFEKEAKKRFSVSDVNINYAKLNRFDAITMRTFERGVENETLSCGTGATAVRFAAYMQFGLKGPMEIEFHSGERLKFELLMKDETLKEIYMMGKVRHVFDGKIRL